METNNQNASANGVVVGDRNTIAGDIVAEKKNYNIAGNATIVENDNEAGRVVSCAVCGKTVTIVDSRECLVCHKTVCSDCFDVSDGHCRNCGKEMAKTAEDEYKVVLMETLSSGRIDLDGRKRLMALQKKLGLTASEAMAIEREAKANANAVNASSQYSQEAEKAARDKAWKLLYEEGDFKKAVDFLEPQFKRNPTDEDLLTHYLFALSRFNPPKARAVVESLQADTLAGALVFIDDDIAHRDLSSAEKRINDAKMKWKDDVLLKCRSVILLHDLSKETDDTSFLMEASELLESMSESSHGAVETSWITFANELLSKALGEEVEPLDRIACAKKGLLWPIVSQRIKLFECRYCIVDLSRGKDAPHYPTYFMESLSESDWTEEFKTDLLLLRRVDPGVFAMGADNKLYGQIVNPSHSVTLTTSYYMGVFEITQRQWELVLGTRPSFFKNDEFYKTRPVERVSFEMIRGSSLGLQSPEKNRVDSDSFLGVVREKTGSDSFDLPTEAQWEYACRAGTTTDFCDGNDNGGDSGQTRKFLSRIASFGRQLGMERDEAEMTDLTGGTTPVGTHAPNSWGFYDMLGNVEEWCLDSESNLTPFPEVDPIAFENNNVDRIIRGSGWARPDIQTITSWNRRTNNSNLGGFDNGFRIALRIIIPDEIQRLESQQDEHLVSLGSDTIASIARFASFSLAARHVEARIRLLKNRNQEDISSAREELKRLSALGYPPAKLTLAKEILNHNNLDWSTIAEAIRYLHQAANRGCLEAFSQLKSITRLSAEGVQIVKETIAQHRISGTKDGNKYLYWPSDISMYELESFREAVATEIGISSESLSDNCLAYIADDMESDQWEVICISDDGIYKLWKHRNNVRFFKHQNCFLPWDDFLFVDPQKGEEGHGLLFCLSERPAVELRVFPFYEVVEELFPKIRSSLLKCDPKTIFSFSASSRGNENASIGEAQSKESLCNSDASADFSFFEMWENDIPYPLDSPTDCKRIVRSLEFGDDDSKKLLDLAAEGHPRALRIVAKCIWLLTNHPDITPCDPWHSGVFGQAIRRLKTITDFECRYLRTHLLSEKQLELLIDSSELGGHEWALRLVEHPELAPFCDWSTLNANDWGELLGKHPEFVERCEFGNLEGLGGKNWVKLLSAQPQLAERLKLSDLEGLSGMNWVELLAAQPQFAVPDRFSDMCYYPSFNGQDWCDLLKVYPSLSDNCPWYKLSGREWADLLRVQPRFAEECNWSKLNGADWAGLLCDQPQFAENCDWSCLAEEDWSVLLQKQPQFAANREGVGKVADDVCRSSVDNSESENIDVVNDEAKRGSSSQETDETIVAIRKADSIRNFIGCTAFSICSLILVGTNPGVAICSVLFFGIGAVVFWKRIQDPRPGLRLNSKGFEFPLPGVIPGSVDKFGLVPWSDVKRLAKDSVLVEKDGGSGESPRYVQIKYLFIRLKDEKSYVNKLGFFKRISAITKGRRESSAIAIPEKSKLTISFVELCELFKKYYRKYAN